jgi:amidophosphoribosyltransferase
MCGIVGLFLKNRGLEHELGHYLRPMLIEMTERGPDSAGIAVYGDTTAKNQIKLTLFNSDPYFAWEALETEMARALHAEVAHQVRANHAVFVVSADPECTVAWLRKHRPEARIMALGHRIEVFKDIGLPRQVADEFGLEAMHGSHGIGHTRMATESGISTVHSHPFWAGEDLCLVHNGSLSNHNTIRAHLRRHGLHFESDNDSEVAAQYLAHRISQGADLKQALEAALSDLDGFYTFCVGTEHGFAVARDAIACKPAVMAETDDWVAMASEYRALAMLPGVDQAAVWEPRAGKVYNWQHEGHA